MRLGLGQAFFDGHVVRYIELLCTYTPAAVLPFIMENEAPPSSAPSGASGVEGLEALTSRGLTCRLVASTATTSWF